MNSHKSSIHWESVCGCVVIPMDDQKLDRIDRMLPTLRESVMKMHYEKHKSLSPLADCKECSGTGDTNYK